LLNFSDWTRSGAFGMIWPLREKNLNSQHTQKQNQETLSK
jgi:hypothetical protein